MSSHYRVVLVSLSITLAGCQQDPHMDAYLETLRAEKLWLEDRFYELEDDYEEQVAKLDQYLAENSSLRQRLGMVDDPAVEIGDRRSILSLPRVEEPGLPEDSIDLGSPVLPDSANLANDRQTPTLAKSKPNSPRIDGKQVGYQRHVEDSVLVDEVREPVDTRVTHIVVNPLMTKGHNFDFEAGDDGISIVLEPRNADDQFVPQTGAVSVVVLDPLLDGNQARIARWEFAPEEILLRLKRVPVQRRGINLKLPWPDRPPQHSQLHLFVRYRTTDGRQLEADNDLYITLPGQFSGRWTPKSSSIADRVVPISKIESPDPSKLEGRLSNHDPGSIGSPVAIDNKVAPVVAITRFDSTTEPQSDNRQLKKARLNRPEWRPFR